MTWSVPLTRKRSSGQPGTLDWPSAPGLKKSSGHGPLTGSSSAPIEARQFRPDLPCGTGKKPGILHEYTSVDVDLLAGDVIAVRHQEKHRFGDFLGVSEATHWDFALDYCLQCWWHSADHVGFSIARAYDVDRDAGIDQLEGGRPAKSDDPSFAGAVVGLPHCRNLAVERADVDDPTVALRRHDRDNRRGAVKTPVEIRLDHPVPLLVGHPGKQGVAGDPCVVHQDVEVSELLGDILDHRPGFLGIADVRLVDDGSSTQFFDFFSQLLCLGFTARIIDRDLGALAGEFDCDGPPDSTRGAGDQRSFSINSSHGRFLFLSLCVLSGYDFGLTRRSLKGVRKSPRSLDRRRCTS